MLFKYLYSEFINLIQLAPTSEQYYYKLFTHLYYFDSYNYKLLTCKFKALHTYTFLQLL